MKYTELEKRKEQERATASAASKKEKHPGYLAWKERRAKQERDKDAPSAYETYKARREARQAAKQKEATEMVNRLLEETNRTSNAYRSRYGDGKRGYRADADQWLEEMNRSRETSRGMAAELSKYLNENRVHGIACSATRKSTCLYGLFITSSKRLSSVLRNKPSLGE